MIATAAPAAWSMVAVARPSPCPPPVTKAVFPVRSIAIIAVAFRLEGSLEGAWFVASGAAPQPAAEPAIVYQKAARSPVSRGRV